MDMNLLTVNHGGIIKNEFENTRVESVDNPQINNALFSLYKQLISPVKEIEHLKALTDIKRNSILDMEIIISDTLKRILKTSIPFGICSILLFFLISTLLDEYHPVVVFLDGCGAWLEEVFFSKLGNLPGLITVILYFAVYFGGMYITPISIPIAIVLFRNRILKTRISKTKNEIISIEKEIENRVENIRDVVCFVPPKYRFSEALTYFVESYENTRISNLKEAVIRFDEYLHRQKVENSLRRIEILLERINRNMWNVGIWF